MAPVGYVPLGTSMTPPPAALKSAIALLSAARLAAAVAVVVTPLSVTFTMTHGMLGGVNTSEPSGAANGVVTMTGDVLRPEHVPPTPPSALVPALAPPAPLRPDAAPA